MTTDERKKIGHKALADADEPIGLTRLLAHSTSLVDDVTVLIGLTGGVDLGIAIYDAGNLHRFRVLELAFVTKWLSKQCDLCPSDALEMANSRMALMTEDGMVRARLWWGMDWNLDVARYWRGEKEVAHHLLDVEFPANGLER